MIGFFLWSIDVRPRPQIEKSLGDVRIERPLFIFHQLLSGVDFSYPRAGPLENNLQVLAEISNFYSFFLVSEINSFSREKIGKSSWHPLLDQILRMSEEEQDRVKQILRKKLLRQGFNLAEKLPNFIKPAFLFFLERIKLDIKNYEFDPSLSKSQNAVADLLLTLTIRDILGLVEVRDILGLVEGAMPFIVNSLPPSYPFSAAEKKQSPDNFSNTNVSSPIGREEQMRQQIMATIHQNPRCSVEARELAKRVETLRKNQVYRKKKAAQTPGQNQQALEKQKEREKRDFEAAQKALEGRRVKVREQEVQTEPEEKKRPLGMSSVFPNLEPIPPEMRDDLSKAIEVLKNDFGFSEEVFRSIWKKEHKDIKNEPELIDVATGVGDCQEVTMNAGRYLEHAKITPDLEVYFGMLRFLKKFSVDSKSAPKRCFGHTKYEFVKRVDNLEPILELLREYGEYDRGGRNKVLSSLNILGVFEKLRLIVSIKTKILLGHDLIQYAKKNVWVPSKSGTPKLYELPHALSFKKIKEAYKENHFPMVLSICYVQLKEQTENANALGAKYDFLEVEIGEAYEVKKKSRYVILLELYLTLEKDLSLEELSVKQDAIKARLGKIENLFQILIPWSEILDLNKKGQPEEKVEEYFQAGGQNFLFSTGVYGEFLLSELIERKLEGLGFIHMRLINAAQYPVYQQEMLSKTEQSAPRFRVAERGKKKTQSSNSPNCKLYTSSF